jgi:hypothetical protein
MSALSWPFSKKSQEIRTERRAFSRERTVKKNGKEEWEEGDLRKQKRRGGFWVGVEYLKGIELCTAGPEKSCREEDPPMEG